MDVSWSFLSSQTFLAPINQVFPAEDEVDKHVEDNCETCHTLSLSHHVIEDKSYTHALHINSTVQRFLGSCEERLQTKNPFKIRCLFSESFLFIKMQRMTKRVINIWHERPFPSELHQFFWFPRSQFMKELSWWVVSKLTSDLLWMGAQSSASLWSPRHTTWCWHQGYVWTVPSCFRWRDFLMT